MSRIVVVHYDEIALKGSNRRYFENRLARNIRRAMGGRGYERVQRVPGRLIVYLEPDADIEHIRQQLQRVFGIVYFSFGIESIQDLETLGAHARQLVQAYQEPYETFKIETKRSNKNYPMTSPEINRAVAAYVLPHINAQVDLTNPDLTCHVEIVNKTAFLYLGRTEGVRGLPVGVSGRVATMLSGGIDSPVAAWRMMRRGCRTDFIHFYSYPYTDKASLEKVTGLVERLTPYQHRSRLYLVPFSDTQLQIVTNSPARLRVILYRRMMIRIAQQLAIKNRCEALVTGECLAQVASQTLRNLSTIEAVAEIPILRPLIGYDKNEIMDQARRIETYKLSTLPYDDCCSLFIPESPATGASQKDAEIGERDLDIPALVEAAVAQTEVRQYPT